VGALSLIFERRMLSESDMQTLDFSKNLIPIPSLMSEETRDTTESNRKEAGLFSTLTQLLSLSSADEDMEAPETAYYLDIGKKCIASCRVQDLLRNSRYDFPTFQCHHDIFTSSFLTRFFKTVPWTFQLSKRFWGRL
jgi:hypothetical protein